MRVFDLTLTFDNGPEPGVTPRVLDVLRERGIRTTFFVIGEKLADPERRKLAARAHDEDHWIGNHTFTHPDIAEISNGQVDLQLNLTERLFGAKLGVQPLYFRPPYSIDQEPDTNDQATPIDRIENLGYVIIGNKIDTNDWDENPRKTPQEITDSVFEQISQMEKKPWMRGSIILLHDGGGDRTATVQALPVLIENGNPSAIVIENRMLRARHTFSVRRHLHVVDITARAE